MKVLRMWKRTKQRDIVRISKRNEQIADDSDETINNVAVNVGT